ncbi:Uncharacterized protein family UPF0497 [Macleaya cordata]|uniref:CASP-like protein n=1 Tax=Macleaya cordata TaxID=56857 RepID=A0A200QGU5_MACCD|nr:Uncharacterized protein family UPF0497 [Macleaya cordata]
METFRIKTEQNSPQKVQRKFVWVEAFLRILGIAATLISIGLMVTSNQTTLYFNLQFVAKYSYSPAFKYFVAANAIACFFSVVSLFLVLIYCLKPSNNSDQKKYFIIFLIDLIATVFELPGCAAATSIGYLGLYGNEHTGWMAICDQFGKFCHKTMVSILIAYVASLLFLFLTIWSAWKSTKSQQPPPPSMY